MKRGLFLIFVLISTAAALLRAQQPEYDIVIHGGMIVDGSGNPWYRADLGIRDGKIVRIGSLSPTDFSGQGLLQAGPPSPAVGLEHRLLVYSLNDHWPPAFLDRHDGLYAHCDQVRGEGPRNVPR